MRRLRRVRTLSSHPHRAQEARKSAACRPPGMTGGCELRTQNHGLSLAKYRAAPRQLPFWLILIESLDLLVITKVYVTSLLNYKALACPNRSAPPPQRNSPPETGAGCGHTLFELARHYSLWRAEPGLGSAPAETETVRRLIARQALQISENVVDLLAREVEVRHRRVRISEPAPDLVGTPLLARKQGR